MYDFVAMSMHVINALFNLILNLILSSDVPEVRQMILNTDVLAVMHFGKDVGLHLRLHIRFQFFVIYVSKHEFRWHRRQTLKPEHLASLLMCFSKL
jgi:hypothetical protein